MKRELWRIMVAALLWAALHDRPVSWACEWRNRPVKEWLGTPSPQGCGDAGRKQNHGGWCGNRGGFV